MPVETHVLPRAGLGGATQVTNGRTVYTVEVAYDELDPTVIGGLSQTQQHKRRGPITESAHRSGARPEKPLSPAIQG
jgi:hypothetical protein